MEFFPPRYITCGPHHHPNRFLDHYVGMPPQPDYLPSVHPPPPFMNCDVFKPWKNVPTVEKLSQVRKGKDKFYVIIDVHHYSPQDIAVKVIDGSLFVEANHEEKADEHGFISRSFSRRYTIPDNINSEMIVSKMSSDGVLTISAPKKQALNERVVPIVQTGPVKKEETEKKEPL